MLTLWIYSQYLPVPLLLLFSPRCWMAPLVEAVQICHLPPRPHQMLDLQAGALAKKGSLVLRSASPTRKLKPAVRRLSMRPLVAPMVR